jgi:hypothetical protein
VNTVMNLRVLARVVVVVVVVERVWRVPVADPLCQYCGAQRPLAEIYLTFRDLTLPASSCECLPLC